MKNFLLGHIDKYGEHGVEFMHYVKKEKEMTLQGVETVLETFILT